MKARTPYQFACALLLCLNAQRALLGDDGTPPIEQVIADFVAKFERREAIPNTELFAVCDKNRAAAVRCFLAYAKSSNPRIRELVYDMVSLYDLHGQIDLIVDALDDKSPTPIRVLQEVDWSRVDPAVRVRARSRVALSIDRGPTMDNLKTLSIIGLAEDLPVLRRALDRVRANDLPVSWVDSSLQHKWEQDGIGIPPFEESELDLRQAMAKLGDPEQLAFFRDRMLGEDPLRAQDALARALEIARPELAEALVHFFGDTKVPPGNCGGNSSPADLACSVLQATFPATTGPPPRSDIGRRIAFWQARLPALLAAPAKQSAPQPHEPPGGRALQGGKPPEPPRPTVRDHPKPATARAEGPEPRDGWTVALGLLACVSVLVLVVIFARRARR